MSPLYPEIISSEIVYEGFFNLRVDNLKYPQGFERPYTVLQTGPEAAVILAETREGQLIINKEYRHPTGEWLLSCPGGRLDPGETPLEAAQRELREETGYTSSKWIGLNSVFPFPAVSDQKIHFLLALEASFSHPLNREPSEMISTELKTPQELMKDIALGVPVDGILCTALLLRSVLNP